MNHIHPLTYKGKRGPKPNPFAFIACWVCNGSGSRPDKRTGKIRPCVACKGEGEIKIKRMEKSLRYRFEELVYQHPTIKLTQEESNYIFDWFVANWMGNIAELKAMTEHLTQEERNEYFDLKINEIIV